MPGTASRTGGHGMPPKMRTITFVDRLTFDFRGNVAQVCSKSSDRIHKYKSLCQLVSSKFKDVTNLKWSQLGSKVFTYFRQNAVCLADVDNDGEYEMVIGNSAGDLAIFKGTGKNIAFVLHFYLPLDIQLKI